MSNLEPADIKKRSFEFYSSSIGVRKVIDKFENTLNEPEKNSVGRWNPSDADIGTGMVGAPACGDVMRLQIKCKP